MSNNDYLEHDVVSDDHAENYGDGDGVAVGDGVSNAGDGDFNDDNGDGWP